MSAELTRSTAALNKEADEITALVDVNAPGKLVIMKSDDTVLSEHQLANPAFGAASGGVCTAGAVGDDTSANATGAAALFKVEDGNALEIYRGTVGTSGEALNLNSTSIVSETKVSVTSLTYTASNP